VTGVGTRVLPFHYTLGMGRTAVWAIALHQGLKLHGVPIFPLSVSISFAAAASKAASWSTIGEHQHLGGIMLRDVSLWCLDADSLTARPSQ
jgi:hypothetical protein